MFLRLKEYEVTGNEREQYTVTVIDCLQPLLDVCFRLAGTFRHCEFMLIVYNCPINCL